LNDAISRFWDWHKTSVRTTYLTVRWFAGVHFVDHYNQLFHTHSIGKDDMFPGLTLMCHSHLKLTLLCGHHQDSYVCLKNTTYKTCT